MKREEIENKTRIVLADSHPEVRSALKFLLEQEPDITIDETVGDLVSLRDTVQRSCPDIIILDWELAGDNGAGITAGCVKRCPGLNIIAISSQPEARKSAREAGCTGFISKNATAEEVIEELKACRKRSQTERNR